MDIGDSDDYDVIHEDRVKIDLYPVEDEKKKNSKATSPFFPATWSNLRATLNKIFKERNFLTRLKNCQLLVMKLLD